MEQFGESPLLVAERVPNRQQFELRLFCGSHTLKNPFRLVFTSGLNEPARTFRNEKEQSEQQSCRRDFRAKHPTPSRVRVPGLIAATFNPRINEKRQKNANHDSKLEERAEASAFGRRRELGDINRANHGRGADPQPTNKSRSQKRPERSRDSRENP